MALRIVIDVRHIKDFGIGTYIRNLLRALGEIDTSNHYFLTTHEESRQEFAHLPANFETVLYPRSDSSRVDHLAYPMFLNKMAPNLTHMPLSLIPLLIP